MPEAILSAIEDIVGAASDIDSIDETIFAEGIGEVPKGFFVAGGNEVELVGDSANGATLYLAMQEEAGGDAAVADKDELTEEGPTMSLNVVLNLLAT